MLAAAGDALSAAELISVLSVSQPFLGGRTGFDLLHVDPDLVIAMIRHIATPDDADARVRERLTDGAITSHAEPHSARARWSTYPAPLAS